MEILVNSKQILKKAVSLVSVMGLLIPGNAFANNTNNVTAVVKGNYVALRTKGEVPKVDPKIKDKATIEKIKNSNIIGGLSKGDVVTVIRPANANGWTQVQVSDNAKKEAVRSEIGYVDNTKLSFNETSAVSKQEETSAQDVASGTMVTVKKSTKFYEKATNKSKVHYTLGVNNKVKYFGTDNYGWAKIQNLAGTVGYCNENHLNIKSSVSVDNTQAVKEEVVSSSTNSSTNTGYSVSVSKFTTTAGKSTDGRLTNINLASSRVHKTVLKPGQEFNMKSLIADKNGKITEKDGYKKASAFSGGKVIQSTGGGICQVATTLYNAALLADLQITESFAHSMRVGYAAPGLDSSYATGAKNLRFKNNKKYPIEINIVLSGRTLTAEFKSTQDVNNGYKFKTRVKQIEKNAYNTYLDKIDSKGNVVSSVLKRVSRYYK